MKHTMTAAGVGALGFLAGLILAGTLAFGNLVGEASGNDAPVPTATPEPTIEPCPADVERLYELLRFARHSHVPWLDRALAGQAGDPRYADTYDDSDVEFQRWWIEEYEGAMATVADHCLPASEYPPLTDLPGVWESYPSRSTAAPAG